MANILNQGSPLELDTPFNPGASAPNIIPAISLYVTKIVWTPANAGDTWQILSAAGKVRASGQAGPSDAGETLIQDFPQGTLTLNPQDGWYLASLSSGKLKIYYTQIGV